MLNYEYNSGQIDTLGQCGRTCEANIGTDNIGVYEFDTVSKTVLTNHVMKEGYGGDPYRSPDGRE